VTIKPYTQICTKNLAEHILYFILTNYVTIGIMIDKGIMKKMMKLYFYE